MYLVYGDGHDHSMDGVMMESFANCLEVPVELNLNEGDIIITYRDVSSITVDHFRLLRHPNIFTRDSLFSFSCVIVVECFCSQTVLFSRC